MIAQVIATTILSFVGFIALFNALGFQIVPPKEIAGVPIPGPKTSRGIRAERGADRRRIHQVALAK